MPAFSIDPEVLAARKGRAQERALKGEGLRLASDLGAGKRFDDEDLATLLLSNDVQTETLLEIARQLRAPGAPTLETFSPLYISNECDAECLMCGMRRVNSQLHRATASEAVIDEQLDILHRRGLRGVALLTGEYRRGSLRGEMLKRTTAAARSARARGFSHVLINIGALEIEEYKELFGGLPPSRDASVLTMCTFQETYDPIVYKRFMGSSDENPRSDFKRRLENFDRAADAGFRSANPGILLGLNHDLAYELPHHPPARRPPSASTAPQYLAAPSLLPSLLAKEVLLDAYPYPARLVPSIPFGHGKCRDGVGVLDPSQRHCRRVPHLWIRVAQGIDQGR